MPPSGPIELFSARVCPYAQRTRLALAEKGVTFELTEIDFAHKPKRFLAVSAYGKVPALVHDGVELYESSVINECLDETFPEPPLMPPEPARRAKARIWIDYCDRHFTDDLYAAIKNRDREKSASLRDQVVSHLRDLEHLGLARLSEVGPFWLGHDVSLVDLAYYPFFERLPAWEHYRGIGIPAECGRLSKWVRAMEERESVKAIANSREYYIERYRNYAGEVLAA